MTAADFWKMNMDAEKDPDSESFSSFNDSNSLNPTQEDASSANASVFTPASRITALRRTLTDEDSSSVGESVETPTYDKSAVAADTEALESHETSSEAIASDAPPSTPQPAARTSHALDFWKKSLAQTKDAESDTASSFNDTAPLDVAQEPSRRELLVEEPVRSTPEAPSGAQDASKQSAPSEASDAGESDLAGDSSSQMDVTSQSVPETAAIAKSTSASAPKVVSSAKTSSAASAPKRAPSSPLVAKRSSALVGRTSHAAQFWKRNMEEPRESESESVSSFADTTPSEPGDVAPSNPAPSSRTRAPIALTSVGDDDSSSETPLSVAAPSSTSASARAPTSSMPPPRLPERRLMSPLIAKKSEGLAARTSHAAEFWKRNMDDDEAGSDVRSVSSFDDSSIHWGDASSVASRPTRGIVSAGSTPMASNRMRSRFPPGTTQSALNRSGVSEDLSDSLSERLRLKRPSSADIDSVFSDDDELDKSIEESIVNRSYSRLPPPASPRAPRPPRNPASSRPESELSVLDRVLKRTAAIGIASVEQLRTALETDRHWVESDESFASSGQWGSTHDSVFSDMTSVSSSGAPQGTPGPASRRADQQFRRPTSGLSAGYAPLVVDKSTESAGRASDFTSFGGADSLAISFSDPLTPSSHHTGRRTSAEESDDELKLTWKKRTRSGTASASGSVSGDETDPKRRTPMVPDTPSKSVRFVDEDPSQSHNGSFRFADDPNRWNYFDTGVGDMDEPEGAPDAFNTPNTSAHLRTMDDSIFKTPASIPRTPTSILKKGLATPVGQPTATYGNGYGPRPSGKPFVFEELITPVNNGGRRLRKRLPPIDRSRNERYVYGYRGDSQMQTVVGVIRNVSDPNAEKQPYRRPVSQDHQSAIEAPMKSLMTSKDTEGAMQDRTIVLTAPEFSAVDGYDDSSQLGEAFGGVTGWVRLAHGAQQEFIADPDQSKVFFVCRGIVALQMNDTIARIPQFGCFIVPPGNQFKLLHASLSTLHTVLSFVALPGDHEPSTTNEEEEQPQ